MYKRYGSRNYLNVCSLSYNFPQLYKILLFNTFSIIGVPGTSIFIAKASFFIAVSACDTFITVLIGVIFLLVLPVFFIRLFLSISGGSFTLKGSNFSDITIRESLIFGITITVSLIIGFYPAIVC